MPFVFIITNGIASTTGTCLLAPGVFRKRNGFFNRGMALMLTYNQTHYHYRQYEFEE